MGNGTSSIFYEQENPLYVSLHGEPDFPYYWGGTDEKGTGKGFGFNVNVPLAPGTNDDTYLHHLQQTFHHIILPYNPQVLVVSLGVDGYKSDPIGAFSLTTGGFARIGQVIQSSGIPVLFVMEGGYFLEEIGPNVLAVLTGKTE